VTYWDNPVAHVRTKFGFDGRQVASGRYALNRYRNFIGFQASRDVLERAFGDTYGVAPLSYLRCFSPCWSCRAYTEAIVPKHRNAAMPNTLTSFTEFMAIGSFRRLVSGKLRAQTSRHGRFSAQHAEQVGDQENQQYGSKTYASSAAGTPTVMPVVASTEAKNQHQDYDE
jgi:hypothetical protein